MSPTPSASRASGDAVTFIERVVELVGTGAVRTGDQMRDAAACTTSARRHIVAVVYPADREQVVRVVRLAARTNVPLYPVSTGNNWGYGTANPVMDGCVLMNLARMNKIVEFDADSGLVTIEPGVTQEQLFTFLLRQQAPFMVPTTGAGPRGSILGNALERGYGITPCADHFAALTSLEAVLPDGSIYQSPLSRMGGMEVDKSFKWGLGPFVDGLFPQGAFGIVTRATIALARRPPRVEAFVIRVARDEMLEATVDLVRELLSTLPGAVGGINVMNARRVLAMSAPYPWDAVGEDGMVPQHVWSRMCREYRVPAWTAFGGLYGSERMVAAARTEVRSAARRAGLRALFITPRVVRTLRAGAKALLPLSQGVTRTLNTLQASLDLISGIPNETALPLAYWKNRTPPPNGEKLDPARDGCGLLWYAPLVDANAGCVRKYAEMVNALMPTFRMEPLITLSSVSERCFSSTVPILFDAQCADDRGRAKECHSRLLEHGKGLGFLPYRLDVDSMEWLMQQAPEHWALVAKLKSALDPAEIISPGRYAPHYAR